MPSSGVQTCARSEEHTSELQSHDNLVCRLLLEKKRGFVESKSPRVRLQLRRAGSRGSAFLLAPPPRAVHPPHKVTFAVTDEFRFFFLMARAPPDPPLFPHPAPSPA